MICYYCIYVTKDYFVGENCVCQVFYRKIEWNHLVYEFAFFPKECLEVSYVIDSGV